CRSSSECLRLPPGVPLAGTTADSSRRSGPDGWKRPRISEDPEVRQMRQFERGKNSCQTPGRPGLWRPGDALGAEMPGSGVRWPMFGSLDYIYIPAADVDGETQRYVQTLGAELVWKVRGMGTTVACLRLGEPGPAILLSGHLRGASAILVYRVP